MTRTPGRTTAAAADPALARLPFPGIQWTAPGDLGAGLDDGLGGVELGVTG
jgi:hypothetical protein